MVARIVLAAMAFDDVGAEMANEPINKMVDQKITVLWCSRQVLQPLMYVLPARFIDFHAPQYGIDRWPRI